MNTDAPVLMTTSEVAELFRVEPLTIQRWIKAGQLEGHRVGREWRFWRSDVMALLGRGEDQ
jgi:excisionase family DNA binding protein